MPKFDLEKTNALAGMFAVPGENRDDAWRRHFYGVVDEASLMSFDPQVVAGPDQFPYFQLAMPDAGAFTPFCVTHILDSVLENGFGIAVFGNSSRAEGPEWVFTYGELLSFRLFGDFDGDPAELARTPHAAKGGSHSVLVAAPSESYLPTYARRALGAYAKRVIQIEKPKIGLIDNPQSTPSRSLMLNLTLADYHGDEKKLTAALHYLSWFLPRTYRIVPTPPGWDDSNFVPLL
jgi:hypothetical protein